MPIDPGSTAAKKLFLLLWAALTAAAVGAQDRIEWEPVDGADHYRVEIRRNGELVLETRSEEAGLPLFLPAGDYEFRVKVINAFDKVASESEWSELRIRAVDVPFIIDLIPAEIHEGERPVFRARVSGYIAGETGSEFRLENGEGDTISLSVETRTEQTPSDGADAPWTEVTLDAGRRYPGEGAWLLVMTNPDGRENLMDPALTVLEKLRPRIRRVTPDEIPAGLQHNTLIVDVDGLEEGALVEFEGPSNISAQLLNKKEKGTLEYSINLQNAEPGWYSVSVTNPSGGEDSKEKAIEVLPRPPTEEELRAAAALKIDENQLRALPEHPHAFMLGWNMSFALAEATRYFANDFIGLSVGFSQEFHNDLIRRIPWLDGLGWYAGMVYSRHRTGYPLFDIYCHRVTFEAGVSYVTPFDFPLNLLVRTGAGPALSVYTSPEYDRDEWIFGYYRLKELDSLDFIARFGLGGRYEISPRWFVDLTVDVTGTFYLSRTVWTLQPRLEGGWRW